jgi:hypothetical protein
MNKNYHLHNHCPVGSATPALVICRNAGVFRELLADFSQCFVLLMTVFLIFKILCIQYSIFIFILSLTLTSKLISLIFALCHGTVLFVACIFFYCFLFRVRVLIHHYATESGFRKKKRIKMGYCQRIIWIRPIACSAFPLK